MVCFSIYIYTGKFNYDTFIMITEDYCSFEVAKLLKEKGFNEQCRAAYTNYGKLFTTQIQQYVTNVLCSKGKLWECTAPTLQMAMKWLREVHNIFIDIEFGVGGCYVWAIVDMSNNIVTNVDALMGFYEQACESAIKYCLENLI